MYMVGVIAAVAALLGAAVGSTATILAAQTQVEGQSSQWTRDERKKLYVQVLEKMDTFFYKRIDAFNQLQTLKLNDLTHDSVAAIANNLAQSRKEVYQFEGQISLLSTPATRKAFEAMASAVSDYMDLYYRVAFASAFEPDQEIANTTQEQELKDALYDIEESPLPKKRIADSEAAFLEAARAEVGVS